MRNRHRVACLSVLAIFGLLSTPMGALAEPPAKVHRVAFLSPNTPFATWRTQPHYRAFLEGLRQLGYVEGQNLVIEFRSAKFDRLPELAAELVERMPNVILVGTCGAPLDATRRATRTIPIIVAACNDDIVAAGIVASLARPAGNVTGIQKFSPELSAKQLALLKEALPKVSRVAVLWGPGYHDFVADWRALHAAAEALGVTLLRVETRGPEEFDTAFAAMTRERVEALFAFSDAMTFIHGRQLVELAARTGSRS